MNLFTSLRTCPSTRCVVFLIAFSMVGFLNETVEGSGSRGGCPPRAIHDPQPTPIPRPDTLLLASPNFGARDSFTAIDSIVMHTTEVSLAGTLDIFQDRGTSVSSHFVVAPNGDIYEMVDTRNRAWHATYYNSRSIGIEMVGFANQASTWNDNNLGSLVDLLAWIVSAYPEVPLTHPGGNAYDYLNDVYNAPGIVGHDQVQPWNKTDPGPFFPWGSVLESVAERVAVAPEPCSLFLLSVATLVGFCRRWR